VYRSEMRTLKFRAVGGAILWYLAGPNPIG